MTEPQVRPAPAAYDIEVPVVIIGAGAAGMIAALAAQNAGADVLVCEADALPAGSTALSAGLIPAAGTQMQVAAGIADTPARFAADIQTKAKGQNPQDLVDLLATQAAPTVDWLVKEIGLALSVVTDFDYPGHSCRRMHGLPTRSGRELVDRLRSACDTRGIDIVCHRRAVTLFKTDRQICGVALQGPDGPETLGCGALVLACNGFGGNRAMVRQNMPEIADALWFGHSGNTGDAVKWGMALGAKTLHLSAYQGHGNVAHPHGILITWAVITEGGIQVNLKGQRFWDESQGYSEAARAVLAQPGQVAWAIFDARIASIARQFEDFKTAERQGALHSAPSLSALACQTGLPENALTQTMSEIPWGGVDVFGRQFSETPLAPPYLAVKVTGALFHTQGGLAVDHTARVQNAKGGVWDTLFAAGGAAVGVSGTGDSGYLSGNGLLSAVVLGRIAGEHAAKQAMR